MSISAATRRMTALIALAAIAMVGCDDDSTDPSGSVAIMLGSPTLVLAQGATGSVLVSVVRGDYDGVLTVSAQGLPAGVLASTVPIASGRTETILVFNAVNAGTGQTTVTIRVAGDGIDTRTAPLTLVVNASAQPPVPRPPRGGR